MPKIACFWQFYAKLISVMKNLVIVESPAKAKTIEKYLGKDFIVRSSYGHIRDLPEKGLGVDIEKNFTPTYEISPDKIAVVKELKKMSREAENVWLATDDDREGEAISWHLKESLDLDDSKTKRIVFREITKNAILKAIQNPRKIDIDLVNAQQARRILDRLVGYELSPVLWKKVKSGLSAGRVQSVAVRLIVEREREIEKFQPTSTFKITAQFDAGAGKTLIAELKDKINTEAEAQTFLQSCMKAKFSIKNLETKPAKKSPAPPFTTSTLQQEASRKLGFSVAQTMTIAQKLYEAGKITYMRTDSTNLSQEAIGAVAKEIEKTFGKKFVQSRQYKTKSETAQEAHEAIRPTDFSAHQIDGDRNEQRLYELIWKRAIASQMADAQLERTIAIIDISTNPALLFAEGEVIKFEGFLKVYLEDTDEEVDGESTSKMLPPLQVGQDLPLLEMKAMERFSRPPARYTEASLVKKLEELGIGRPSTYAPTISTILKRGYVVKENREGKERKYQEIILKNGKISAKTKTEIVGSEKAKLFPTDVAMVVNDFLQNHFESIVDYSFTAKVEKQFDEIAEGKQDWVKMIKNFYKDFHPKIEETEDIKKSDVVAHRELGTHPETGEKVFAKLGKYGAYVQIGEAGSERKPLFAKLKKGQFLETITLQEALELFKLPREVGSFEGKTLTVAIGRFGPYVKMGNEFFSLGKDDDPYSITEERAIEIIEAKRKADAEKIIKTFSENPEVQVLNGKYGAYIKVGKQNVKIPKEKEPQSLTLEECLQLAQQQSDKEKTKNGSKKKS